MMKSGDVRWRCRAPLDVVRARARMLAEARAFFREHGVLEVETPVLSRAATPAPHLHSLVTHRRGPDGPDVALYLHTSPEFPMKRLLAAGSGPIYQICKVFRDEEQGRLHSPEFTLLEWYRPGLGYHELMDEVESFAHRLLRTHRTVGPAQRITYREALRRYAGIDPFEASTQALVERVTECGVGRPESLGMAEPDDWLDLLVTHVVEPALPRSGLCFIYDFPASQAALARVRGDAPPVAERFELYLDGVELANGYQELTDPREQRRRFEAELARRSREGRTRDPLDEHFLAALDSGLPDGAGVALGMDRLLMQAVGADSIHEVLAFPVDRA